MAMKKTVLLVFAFAIIASGCGESTADGDAGTGGISGSGGVGGNSIDCRGSICPCSEAGIRAAIAAGGGPYTFECEGLTRVVTEAEIVIDKQVILDGESKLIVDGNEDHRVFSVPPSVTAELRGFTITRGLSGEVEAVGGGITNAGTLMLTSSTVSDNTAVYGGGAQNVGTLVLTNSTVSGNRAERTAANSGGGGGIANAGTLTLLNSTVAGNLAFAGGGIWNGLGTLELINSTVADNFADFGGAISIYDEGTVTLTNSLVDGDCVGGAADVSGGGNLESPGDTCGFDQPTDQANVSAEDLRLGPLQDNGGPTMTHALLPGSVAIDVIAEAMCEVETDQRGEPRPGGTMCDVGAFEVQE